MLRWRLEPCCSRAHPELDAPPDAPRSQPRTAPQVSASAAQAGHLLRGAAAAGGGSGVGRRPAGAARRRHTAQTRSTSGSQREPPAGHEQNCRAKLLASAPSTNSTTAYPGTGDTAALLERGSEGRHCGPGSNGTDLAGDGQLAWERQAAACSQPRSLPDSPRPFSHVPHPARSPDGPGSPAVLTQLLSTSCSRSPRHSRLRGPQQMEVQPCWVSCCSNTCAQDQVQLAGGHYKEESRIQCPAVQRKQSTRYNLVLPPPEQQGWHRG